MVVVVVVVTPDFCGVHGNSAVYIHDSAKLRNRPLLYLHAVLLFEDIIKCC